MISTRRAALLGLAVPLSSIMVAVLGLWPEDDAQPPPFVGGGGAVARPAAPRLARPRPAWVPMMLAPRNAEEEEALLLCGAL